jgi:pimeloyl-ACP methyl ester carboxylesterase
MSRMSSPNPVSERGVKDSGVTLYAADGVKLAARWLESSIPSDTTFVMAHGFTGSSSAPKALAVRQELARYGNVLAIDFRGHGSSEGASTVGLDEVIDVDAAVAFARGQGAQRVASIGFSMGGAVVVRHAAGASGERYAPTHSVDAVVSVSAPAFWYYRGTRMMRIVHHLVENRVGRAALRAYGTRVSGSGWPAQLPITPETAAEKIRVPMLVVHGDSDHYFPLEHARAFARANPSAELWIVPGFRHAESGVSPATVGKIASWVVAQVNR